MPDTTTGAFIPKDDPNLHQAHRYVDIRLDLIRQYMDNQPGADTFRIYDGTYAGADTRIAVMVQDQVIRYFNAGGTEQVLEHLTPAQD